MKKLQAKNVMLPIGKKYFSNRICGFPDLEWPNGVAPHYHDFFECELLLSGAGSLFINSTEFDIQRGLFYILEPTDACMYRADGNAELEIYSLKFTTDMLSSDVWALLRQQKKPFACTCDDKLLDRILRKLDEINSVVEGTYIPARERNLSDRIVQGMIDEIVLTFIANSMTCSVVSEAGTYHNKDKIRKVVHWIDIHCTEMITIKQAAKKADVSEKYFRNYFKMHVGVSFREYLYRARLNYAIQLLENTNMSMKEICYKSGFSTASHFSRVFAQYIGVTPTEYRNKSNS
jgi:AraC-like DNA-binding protein